MIDNKLKSNLDPSWNFGPYKKNCKKVITMVNLLSKQWDENRKKKIVIRKNKKFKESQLLSLNIEKARRELGWKPRLTLEETINFTIDWYKSFFSNGDIESITNYQIEYFIEK